MREQARFQWDDAEAYEGFMGRWSALIAPPFLAAARIPPNAHVLDLGCGTGVSSLALAEAGAVVTGVDSSQPYLTAARQHPRITYELGDAFALRFADGALDAALCTLVLDIFADAVPAVLEMRRVTRPRGVVAACVTDFWAAPNLSMVWDAGAVLDPGLARLRDAKKSHPLAASGGLAALWRSAGLVEVTEVPFVVDCVFADFADYWATVASGQGSLPASVQALDVDVAARLEAEVRAGYLAGMPDGPRCFPKLLRAARGVVPK